jgi:hypothetical protein
MHGVLQSLETSELTYFNLVSLEHYFYYLYLYLNENKSK